MKTEDTQTLVLHPQTGVLFASAHRWRDATYALITHGDGFRPVWENERGTLRRMFGDLFPQYPGEYAELSNE